MLLPLEECKALTFAIDPTARVKNGVTVTHMIENSDNVSLWFASNYQNWIINNVSGRIEIIEYRT